MNELPLRVHRVLQPPGAFKSQKITLARLVLFLVKQTNGTVFRFSA